MVKMKTLLSIFIISLMPVTLSAQALAPSEAARQKIVEKMDKNGLRFRTQAVTEQSDKLIQIPDFIQNRSGFEHRFFNCPIRGAVFNSGPG
jgi:hypothetical protein